MSLPGKENPNRCPGDPRELSKRPQPCGAVSAGPQQPVLLHHAQEPQAERCCPAPPNGVHTALGMRRVTVPPRGCSLHRDAPAEGISGCETCSTGTCCPRTAWCSSEPLGSSSLLGTSHPEDLASATSRPPCLLSHSMPRSQKFLLPTFPPCFTGLTSSCSPFCLSDRRQPPAPSARGAAWGLCMGCPTPCTPLLFPEMSQLGAGLLVL